MNGIQSVQAALTTTGVLLREYIKDLSDGDLLVRPVPGANHLAWQLGHLISSEGWLVKEQLPEAEYPQLPANFAEAYTKETAGNDAPAGFLKREEYLALFNAVRKATIETVGKLTDADLDGPSRGRMAPFAPTLGLYFHLVANHTLMHAGQFTVLRRKLGKPVLF